MEIVQNLGSGDISIADSNKSLLKKSCEVQADALVRPSFVLTSSADEGVRLDESVLHPTFSADPKYMLGVSATFQARCKAGVTWRCYSCIGEIAKLHRPSDGLKLGVNTPISLWATAP